MSKRRSYLDVDWVELGCRGWEIDATGAEAAYLDPAETMGCHLDRTTLAIILCGDAAWCLARLRDLADAGVHELNSLRTWRLVGGDTISAASVKGPWSFTSDTTEAP